MLPLLHLLLHSWPRTGCESNSFSVALQTLLRGAGGTWNTCPWLFGGGWRGCHLGSEALRVPPSGLRQWLNGITEPFKFLRGGRETSHRPQAASRRRLLGAGEDSEKQKVAPGLGRALLSAEGPSWVLPEPMRALLCIGPHWLPRPDTGGAADSHGSGQEGYGCPLRGTAFSV